MNTFLDPLRRAEQCFADRPALVDDERRLTYGEVGVRARRLAGAVAALGVRPGDRVAVYAENSAQYAELALALPAAGIVLVPLNIRHALVELEAVMADCAPRLLFTDRFHADHADALAKGVEHAVTFGDDFEHLVAGGRPADDLGAGVSPDDLAVIYYTGGTTARAKGVMMSHANKIADAFHLLVSSRLETDDAWLVMGPMFHASGSFHQLPCAWVGAAQVILRRFEAHAALAAIQEHRATVSFGVPTMLRQLSELQGREPHDVSSLRMLGHGGAPITQKDLRATHEAFPAVELVGMYGATEMGPLATAVEHQERLLGTEKFRSCGRAAVGVELAILDDDGRALPVGETGEIAVRGPAVMHGYWNNEVATQEVLRDGWYLSGDVGRLDDQHLLYILDRKKDMIITGGENVYGAEVEDVLIRYPGVAEAAVFGVDDEEWGQAVHAVLVSGESVDPASIDPAAVRLFCRELLANYKVPKQIRVQGEPLPKSGAGKVLKRQLRQDVEPA